MRNLDNNSELDFETFINENPYMDESIISILELNVNNAGFQNASIIEKYRYLSQLFELTLYEFNGGVKFE